MLKIKEMIKKSSAKYGFNTYDIIYISSERENTLNSNII